MTKTMKAGALLACLLGLICLPAYATNLLTNPGFETGDFTGWTVAPSTPIYGVASAGFPVNSFWGNMPVIVNSGTYAAYSIVCDSFGYGCQPYGDYNHFLTLSQTVNMVAGQTYQIGFWWGDPIQVGYGNSSNITVNGNQITFTSYPYPSYGWVLEDGYYIASSTGPATVSFLLWGSGYGDANFSFDDFYVNSATPEPSSLLLLGSGLLGAVGVIRRKINL